jgi:Fe-S cluster biogenesis protein NfuA
MNLQSLLNKVTGMSDKPTLKVRIQTTPNPDAKKFIVNVDLRKDGKATFSDKLQCEHVPLAEELLNIENVDSVHFFENVVTVTQNGKADWIELQEMVEGTLFSLAPDHDPSFKTAEEFRRNTLSPEIQAIEAVLDQHIRPFLQGDGGDVEVVGLNGKILTIKYEGACGTCPSSAAGTLHAIQSTLQEHFDPEIDVVTM